MADKILRALVVDDELLNRKLAVALLNRMGWETLEAENGKRALEVLQTEMPRVVLLDISMPEMSGEEVCRRLRADPRLRGVGVVAYTAHATPGDETRLKREGFDALLIKPVSREALRAALEKLADGRED